MNKAYERINWKNYPSDATPLNESNLNKLDSATDTIDNRVIALETTKAAKTEVATLVADVTFEESTGIITITKKNGSKIAIDTQMEKIAVNFDYDPTTQQIILTLIDGTKQYIDLSALITQYEFLDTDTVAFAIGTDGKVSAIVKEGSIEEKHLRPDYLSDIKLESVKAQASQSAAKESAAKAESYAVGDENSAKYYYEKTKETIGGAVTGVKGSAETAYRTGNINITPENIGAYAKENIDQMMEKVNLLYTEYLTAVMSDGTTISAPNWTTAKYLKAVSDSLDALADLLGAKQDASTAITTSNIGNQSVNYAGSAGAVAWGNVSGKPTFGTAASKNVSIGNGSPFGKVPYINEADGVMEVGKYIDFHENTSTQDYDVRIEARKDGLTLGGTTKGSFEGTLNGTATSATSAGLAARATCDTGGRNIYDTFNKILNGFLPLSGGILQGDLRTSGGARFPTTGNVYVNDPTNGCVGWLSNLLAARIPTTASCNRNWNYSGQGGQPAWLWGSNSVDGSNNYVWNPANFDVYSSHHIVTGTNGNVSVGLSGEGANFRTYVKSTGAALDNAVNLGSGSYRWKQVFAGTSAISTSDRNLKKNIEELSENHLKFFLMLIPVSYQFIDGDSGRTHIGFIAQDVEGAMAQCGFTALDFAGFCKDTKTEVYWEEDENGEKIERECPVVDADGNPKYIYSLRYEEFIALTTYATQKLYKKVDEMEARMERMEDRLAALEK